MRRTIEGKVTLVTGGGGQFGRTLCRALSQRGCKLIVGDCDLSAARLTAAQTQGLALGLDVTDLAMWANAASSARDLFGPIEYVFHCAQHHVEADSDVDYARLWSTQVSALELAQQTCGADLVAKGGLHILFVSSAAWQANPNRPLWSAAEAAKRQWHKAQQLGSRGIQSALIAYDVPPRPNTKTSDEEIAAATLWALSRGEANAFVPGGFGVTGFCRKSAL